ncbi:cadherin-like beta sandwich domain-containing protein [Paenibacillus cremeus]|uniref:SLH domain-containing protein n=1 Tax=Paenibacillus cremeus TaxID=2163881 RepID=A0A559KB93_9BACL|nr:cadherin-like beta sandwich domain-containing protein [Paenibacillus cremeus]TVY09400.1 hypothetical protein FPZ49_13170 [Paenibacillus cremeus]
MSGWRDSWGQSFWKYRRWEARFILLGLFIVAGVCFGFVGSVHAAAFSVNTNADTVDSSPGDGICADSSGKCSLRAAVMEANAAASSDDISIPSGTYTLTAGELQITNPVRLLGTNQSNTIIQAASTPDTAASRVFNINSTLGAGFDVTIQGLTIRYGKVSADANGFGGGGIGADVGNKTLTIRDSIIDNNVASGEGYGGGLYVSGTSAGSVVLSNVTVSNNKAGQSGMSSYGARGGGIYLEGDMTLSMTQLNVTNNASYGQGGGMAIVSATASSRSVAISSSSFTGNHAYSSGSTPNKGPEGRAGGLYLGSPAVITGTDFTGNTADGDGGGLVLDYFAGTVGLTNVTVTGNTAARGGGLFVNANKAPSITGTTSFSGNTGGDVAANPESSDLKVTIAPAAAPNGTFAQGKTGAHYSVTVRNNGTLKTSGTVTATVTLPAGLTATNMTGTGWSCTVASLTCTSSDVRNGQSDFPVIDVTVNVAPGTSRTVTSTAQVSGGNELDFSNDTGTHTTTVLSNDATLKGLAASSVTLNEPFAAGTLDYTANVLYAVSSITVTPTVNESHATVKVNTSNVNSGQASGAINLAVGSTNVISVVATAEDGTTTMNYTITVTRAPKSTNANLSDLKVDGVSIGGFAPNTTSYTLNVPNSKTTMAVTGTKADATATVVVAGDGSLAVGTNTITVTVTAEDATVVKTYTVTVVRAPSSNANLSDLKLNGTSVSGFASGTLDYTVNVPNATTSVAVTSTKEDATATVAVNGGSNLAVGENTVTVTVTAQDTTTVKVYTVTVVRAPSSNALLSDLQVDGTSIAGFTPGTVSYSVYVPNATTSVVVTGLKADATANVAVTGGSSLAVGQNTVTVKVTAEDTTTVVNYTVTIVRAPSSNAFLSDLKVDGTSIAGFASNTVSYSVYVPNATTSVVVTGLQADATANVVVTGGSNLAVGNNTVTVTVTAEDSTTTLSYTITVRRQAADPTLNALTVNGTGVAGFAPGTLSYTVSVPNATTAITAVGTAADANAAVSVTGGSNLTVGDNTVTVKVTAEDPSITQTYTLKVHRISANANLSDLKVSGTSVAGFTPGTVSYAVYVPNATTSVVVTGTTADANASLSVTGGSNLVVGSNTVTATVTAEDTTTVKAYTVTVVRAASNNASLSGLKVDGISVTGFAPGTLGYTVYVPNATTSVVVTGTAADVTASLVVNGGSNLVVGSNTATVTVTAQDATVLTYTVNVVRAGSSNVALSGLLLNGTSVPGFAPGVLDYTTSVTNTVYSVSVTASVYDPASRIKINNIDVLSGQSQTILLQDGPNKITVKVLAQDQISVQDYAITITRYSSASLTGLAVGGVNLSPSFNAGTLSYTGTVPYGVSSVTVTGSVYDPNASLLINGVAVRGGVPSSPMNLTVGLNTIQVVVTPAYGAPSQPYTIVLTRQPQPSSSSGGGAGGGSTSVLLTVDGNGKTLQVDVQRTLTPDGRVIDKMVITPDIVKPQSGGAGSEPNAWTLVIPKLPAESTEFNVNVPMNTLQVLADNGLTLRIATDDVQISLAKDAITKALAAHDEVYFRFAPIQTDAAWKETEKRVLTAQLVTKAAAGGEVTVLGRPMTIETNVKNQETKLNFSLKDMKLPSDPKERAKFLSSLRVYVEHSDGEKELVKGAIRYDAQDQPVSIEIVVTKFSTFSIVEIQKKPIDTLTYKRWIDGYPNGTFKPNQSITRAEAAAIFVKALELPQPTTEVEKFSDVSEGHWAEAVIRQVQSAGLLSGYPDGSFKPDAAITRAELAAIIARLKKLSTDDSSGRAFTDTQGHWAEGAIQAVKAAELMSGYEDGSFRPDQPVTRAEAVKVINTLLKRPTPMLDKDSWTDVSKQDWFWLDVQSASSSFSHTRYTDGSSDAVVIP